MCRIFCEPPPLAADWNANRPGPLTDDAAVVLESVRRRDLAGCPGPRDRDRDSLSESSPTATSPRPPSADHPGPIAALVWPTSNPPF